MNKHQSKLSVRAVSNITRQRLTILKEHTRLPFGALVDDSIEVLWNDYLADGHDLPDIVPETEDHIFL
ncbi:MULTISPECIES: hypothetical protein [Roseobacteraceae]|uniref:hypothetical protein n=1 Tax=Roseobacteraceae TaxID=2854170 RepID=UPI002611F0DF|nr:MULTISPECIES: hypothetical protein [Roseobacteraceae]